MFRSNSVTNPDTSVKNEAKNLRDEIAFNKQKQQLHKLEIAKLLKEINELENVNLEIEKHIKKIVTHPDSELSELINKAFFSYHDKGHHCVVDNEALTLSIYFYAPDSTKDRFIKLVKNIDKDVVIQTDLKSPRGAVIITAKLQYRGALCKKMMSYDALQAIIDYENECEDAKSIKNQPSRDR